MCLSWRVKKANKFEKPHTQVQQTCFITSKGNASRQHPAGENPRPIQESQASATERTLIT